MPSPGPRDPGPLALLRPLLLLLCALAPCAPEPSPESAAQGKETLDIVHPVRVDAGGAFLSFELWPRALQKRALSAPRAVRAFYQLQFRGRDLRFHLAANRHLLAPGFVSETHRLGGLGRTHIRTNAPVCHLMGEVQDPELEGGLAAISACDGLKGVFRLNNQDYFIEPLEGVPAQPGQAQPHVVYQRQASEQQAEPGNPGAPGTCGVQGPTAPVEQEPLRRDRRDQQRRQRRHHSSESREKWVEALVVADSNMVKYHGQPDVENYVLTIMNMVAGIFRDPNIGNPIHITVVRLIVLEEEKEDMKVVHQADRTLNSFCKWQKSLNMQEDSDPLHHDTAILITRKDLCSTENQPCETLGQAHVGGICQPHLSCSINEDTGLPSAFTVAHELGHSLGIQHDGTGNDCDSHGKWPFIMAPQILYNNLPLTWSNCSRDYITRFFDRGWGTCLDDPPAKDVISAPYVLPGVLYDADHQCRLQYGPDSMSCRNMDNVCHTLWCSMKATCNSRMDGAVDGTTCGDKKWCLGRECVSVDFQPETVDGGWSGWSAWSGCSRSCGVGVQSSERRCEEPPPRNRGKYCVGERKRVRLCNVEKCPPGSPSFRQVQCSRFDTTLYKGQLHKWVPVTNDKVPCELHCRPWNETFSDKLLDAVVDGTPCYEDRQASLDVCINGICQNVGCDFEIDSGAVEDYCGVCKGNGSTCHTVRQTFQDPEGNGYMDVALIPAGARHILIQELAESTNFLALRSEDPDKHFFNGGWAIHSDGDYKVAGTFFTYERRGEWEKLTSPGPTNESVWIQLLLGDRNPGLLYEYVINLEASTYALIPDFFWTYGPWTECTVTCGTGVQKQSVSCMERQRGRVDKEYCEFLGQPDDRQRTCINEPCPAQWWAGEWQPCSRSCGPGGHSRRAVVCIRSVGPGERSALPLGDCGHLPQPPAEMPCSLAPCPASWVAGRWSECSVTCGPGTQQRAVVCANDTGVPCEEARRPAGQAACSLQPCPLVLLGPEGSGSGSSSRELYNEVDFPPGPLAYRPAPPSPPETPSKSNAIPEEEGEGPKLGPPGPAFVDDFYYDYNFIQFHEDLSQGEEDDDEPSQEPGPLPAGTGGRLTPSLSSPTEPPTEPPAPRPSQPGPAPPPPSEQTPWDPALNFLPEEDDVPPTETPALGLPSSPWSPAPGDETPTAPGSQGGPSRPPPPRWETTNEVSEDEAEAWDRPVPHLPPMPWSPPLSSTLPGLTPAAPGGHQPGVPTPRPVEDRPAGSSGSPEAQTLDPLDHAPTGNASWEVGNWSQCSTTCGLGATWRSVHCSSGREEDCAPEGRPQPARRCHLRPCATWHTGNWSKCSHSCGGGSSVRDVQCVDTRDLRPLRPFHCRPGPAQPPARRACGAQPCLSWYTSSWRECSEACGGGEQHRLVTCPEPGLCQEALRPNATRPCNTHPCTKWVVGPWSECSAPCGGGVQRRLIRCVNIHLGLPEEDSHQCSHEPWPQSSRPCGTQDCEISEDRRCEQDRLPFAFCQTLRLLGRCQLPSARAQCCRSCVQPGHTSPARGPPAAARR